MINKLISWIKKPENIILLVIFSAITIMGIIDGNLIIIIKVYAGIALFSVFIVLILYLKSKFW
ncbi:hypothetical protein SAMN05444671_0022 [Flavobacterium sp. CF108]|jgi:hypothetical protein|nr:hypothetical protein SAMN04487978_0594 [Flavobacterium sp. fv08]SHI03770.1 hypothetical protein SAMN05444671_0022 [Flavobacterium sp. CF108]